MEIQFLCAEALNGGNQTQIGEVPVQSPRGSDAVSHPSPVTRQRHSADPHALDTCHCSDDSWGSAPCMALVALASRVRSNCRRSMVHSLVLKAMDSRSNPSSEWFVHECGLSVH